MCCNPETKAHASVMESVKQLFSNVITNILMVMAMTTTMMIPAMTNNSGVVNSKNMGL